jgi:hypothetical protein
MLECGNLLHVVQPYCSRLLSSLPGYACKNSSAGVRAPTLPLCPWSRCAVLPARGYPPTPLQLGMMRSAGEALKASIDPQRHGSWELEIIVRGRLRDVPWKRPQCTCNGRSLTAAIRPRIWP